MIKISIIIPVYNVERYIGRCLDSIINQSLDEIEIILINDGSQDKSLNICKKYEEIDSRISVINKVNEGPSIARNLGIDIAKGEYIMFIDADDWIEDNMLTEMYKLIKEKNVPICISNYFRNYGDKEDKVNLNFKDILLDSDQIKEKLIFPLIGKSEFDTEEEILGFGAPWGKLFDLKFLNRYNIKFKEELLIGEDLLFNIEALSKSSHVAINTKSYYHYWENNESIMKRYKDNCWEIYKKSIKSIEDFLTRNKWEIDIQDRFKIMKIGCVTRTINNECSSKNVKTFKEKISYIKQICKDDIVTSTLDEIDYSRLSFKRKCILSLIKYRLSIPLYIFTKIR